MVREWPITFVSGNELRASARRRGRYGQVEGPTPATDFEGLHARLHEIDPNGLKALAEARRIWNEEKEYAFAIQRGQEKGVAQRFLCYVEDGFIVEYRGDKLINTGTRFLGTASFSDATGNSFMLRNNLEVFFENPARQGIPREGDKLVYKIGELYGLGEEITGVFEFGNKDVLRTYNGKPKEPRVREMPNLRVIMFADGPK